MAKTEIPELRALRDAYDEARRQLLAGIHKHLAEGRSLAEIGRSVDWSSGYVAQIRDGQVTE